MENTPALTKTKSRWHLLGAGSLGCLFAAYLQRASVALEIIVRDEAALQTLHGNGGITLTRGERHTTIAIAAATPQTVSAPISQLLVCTKAPQTLAAIAAIRNHLATDARIVLLQNGMGVRELVQHDLLQHALPHVSIFHALSTEGAFRTAPFHVTHAGQGETVIGTTKLQQQALAATTTQSLQCELPITFAADIEQRLWLKLAVNSVINPLTALHRCRNGELLQRENIKAEVAQLCDELAQITRSENIDLNTEKLRTEVYRVMRATAHNKSSMLQDIEAGRATEIDFINGFIVQRAHAHRLECTRHTQLLQAVRALQP